MVMVLGMNDTVYISLWAINLSVSLAISIVLYRVNAVTKRFERLEDARDREVDTLNTKLHDAATKLIDERFRAMTHELNTHVNGFSLALDVLKDRLKDGDQELDGLEKRNMELEHSMAGKVEQLKDFIRQYIASRDELQKLREDAEDRHLRIETKVNEMRETVAVLANSVNLRRGGGGGGGGGPARG